MSRGLRNNNPGNIVKGGSRFKGEVAPSSDARFRQFESMAWGYRAMLLLLRNYKELHGCGTIRQMIGRWAPPSENETAAYVDFVSKETGVAADAEVDVHDRGTMVALASAISRMENGRRAVASEVEAGWELL